MEVLVSACASHHPVIHLLTTQHDGSWHASDILPTLQGEGDELYGVWDVYLHQVVHKLAPLIGGHAPVSTKNHQSPLLRDGAGHVTQVDMCMAEIVIQANTQHSKPKGQGLMPQIGQVDLP